MSGFDNEVEVSIGERLQPSTAQAVMLMQGNSDDVSRINNTGNPEDVISANPSSWCHDPVTGIVYYKFYGTAEAGWVPVFQPLSNKVANFYEDFFNPSVNFFTYAAQNTIISSTDGHPGLLMTGSTVIVPPLINGFYSAFNGPPFFGIITNILIGSGVLNCNYVVNLNTLSLAPNNYIAYFGLTDTMITGEPPGIVNGIWFSYTDSVNSGNWLLNSASGGVVTSVDSGVPASTDYVNLGIRVNPAGTLIQFYIGQTQVGTISTNLPVGVNMGPFMNWSVYGTDPSSLVDLFYLTYVITTTR